MFFDEPFPALDPLIRRTCRTRCAAHDEGSARRCLSTPRPSEALRLGDRGKKHLIMRAERSSTEPRPDRWSAHPDDYYVREFSATYPSHVLDAALAGPPATPADALTAEFGAYIDRPDAALSLWLGELRRYASCPGVTARAGGDEVRPSCGITWPRN